MKKITIAEITKKWLDENNLKTITHGDSFILDSIFDICKENGVIKNQKNKWSKILNGLERSQLFEKHLVKCQRMVRTFTVR